jgi:CBS domain-containing protein
MRHHEPVSKIMSHATITAHPGQKLSEVRALLSQHGFHHVPVVSGKQLLGVVSATDILRLSFGDPNAQDGRAVDAVLDHAYKLEDVMSKEVQTLGPKDTVKQATEILAEGKFHSLPIVENGELVGIVTTTDLLRYLLAQY